jgi:8-oxo-dGTP pyrophosphatase MutT (NUDIX family)
VTGPGTDAPDKVVAYITHGRRLLVFSHVRFPEAGIQVPAGTVKPDEPPDRAVLREAHEESGLVGLRLRAYLGTADCDRARFGLSGRQRFHFYHLVLETNAPSVWRHFELDPSDGSAEPIEFELFWVPFPDGVPDLVPPHADLLGELAL